MKKDSFYYSVFMIAVPVALQCMLQSSFSIVDQIMIGQLGSNSIAAVGLAGKFASIFSVVVAAVGSVAGIMIAQYLGAKDEKEADAGFFVNLVVALGIAVLFMAVCIFAPVRVMSLYTKSSETVTEAGSYLRIVSFMFVPMAGSTLIATLLRCKEKATLPLVATIIAVVCNTILNYILIFGKFGFDECGSKGAAFATVISQWVNFILMVLCFTFVKAGEHKKLNVCIRLSRMSKKDYLMILIPILVNEFLWSLGENIYAMIYGHLGTLSCAAMTLTNPIQGLMIGALSGLSGAAGVLIGKNLGKKDFDLAYSQSKKLLIMGLFCSVIFAIILVLCRGFYVRIFNVEDSVRLYAVSILLAFAIICPVKVMNMIMGGGILRSGGDTKTVMYIDMIGTWIFGIPLGLLSAFVLKFPVYLVYFILSLEECVRLCISLFLFRKKKWMQTLDRS